MNGSSQRGEGGKGGEGVLSVGRRRVMAKVKLLFVCKMRGIERYMELQGVCYLH